MSSANTFRDFAADANPELPRKRERLSEETDTTSPHSPADGSIVVEALPPDELGASYENAIELHDEPAMTTSLIDGFTLQPGANLAPAAQLDFLIELCNANRTLEPIYMERLAWWVVNHVNSTRHDSSLWQDAYLDEAEFFSKLGKACWMILDSTDDIFDRGSLMTYGFDRVADNLVHFQPALTELSIRFLTMLPDMVDTLMARRDSGQVPKSRQNIDFLCYIQLLAQALASHRFSSVDYLRNMFHFKPKAMARAQQNTFITHASASASLVDLLQKLAQHHREVTNAWDGIDSGLRILGSLPAGSYKGVQRIMDTAHHRILPVICEKHPRALPETFHELLLHSGEELLKSLCADANIEGIIAMYDRYIKGDGDALLRELTNEKDLSALLQETSNHDNDILNELMTTAWTLKALKAFIYSDIMDVRSCGISLLSKRLLHLYQRHQPSKESFDHPVLQYVARFMRSNELTKYIFGPNSHASLVNHSQNIIGFLAATSAYTDLETDIIWHACTNSVEAEFVKASFVVLVDLCRYLELDQLLYLAQKFAATPPSKLGKDAVDSLTDLFQRVQIKSGETGDQRHRLDTAFISIDIMMQIEEAEENVALTRLREVARSELERFTDPTYSTEDRIQIYSRCVPALVHHGTHATTSMEIMVLFLRTRKSDEEANALLGMLPIQATVDELGHYVDSHRGDNDRQQDACVRAIAVRIEAIIRLMRLVSNIGEDIVPRLFRYTVGDLALSNSSRDRSWQLLMALASSPELAPTAAELLRRFLAEEAAKLPMELVTPELIRLFGIQLRTESKTASFGNNFTLILDTAIWEKLIHTAESVNAPLANPLATQLICDILFDVSQHPHSKEEAIKCHAAFANRQITRICQEAASPSTASEGSICRKLGLLSAVLDRSRETQKLYKPDISSEICLSTDPEAELVHCNLQVYGGGQTHPTRLRLQAKLSNTLSDLLAQLPAITGAAESRVILGGKSLDSDANLEKTLLELGVHASSVISICPRHTFASDLGLVLTSPGPVEQEVLVRYDELENLLDGPDNVAQQVYAFLAKVRPPTATRQRVCSANGSTAELCPPTKPWRTGFSFWVLKIHLIDFAQLGVADPDFLLRGVALLVDVLGDNSRPFHATVILMALDCLVTFLQENPDATGPEPIADPAAFASRMVDVYFQILESPRTIPQEIQMRKQLADLAFRTLLQAFRRQPAIWRSFAQDPRIAGLHDKIVFDPDPHFAGSAMNMIRNFCVDSSSDEDVADFYLTTLLALVPQALPRRDRANQFFSLTMEVLVADRILRQDESRVREIAASLLSTLWSYEHIESVTLPITDTSVTGLLRLLVEVIAVVKSFKKPLELQGVSSRIFNELLFPPFKAPGSRPLVHQLSRRLAFQLVQSICESREEFSSLLDATIWPLQDGDGSPTAKYPGLSNWLRPVYKCSGLPNLGMTCYMNSLLQQLFANVHFRKFLLETPIVNPQRQALLAEVQELFACMQDSYAPSPETINLAKVLNIQTDSQEDVHGFYEDFLSRLEANMPDAESKAKLTRFFTGKLISQIKGECGHISPKTEPFVDLPVIVKNKTCLPESLDEFVQGEPMEGANQYKCLACDTADGGKLVNAMRRACPEEMPDNLTFCLKRFTFEAMLGMDGKVNDRFEFPQTIDMSKYQRAHLEDPTAKTDTDIFELVGVIVHQGTLHLGHYWSYTLLRNTAIPTSRTWVKLEDRSVIIVPGGHGEVQNECVGGQRYSNGNERADNAYVLFYQRKSALEEPLAMPGLVVDPMTQILLPPKVPVQPEQARRLQEHNAWRHRVAHLFEDDFSSFVMWLLRNYENYRAPSPASSDSGSPEDTATSKEDAAGVEREEEEVADNLMLKVSQVAMMYIQRVAVADPAPMARLQPCVAQLKQLIGDQPGLVVPLMKQLVEDPTWFSGFFCQDNKDVRTLVIDLVIQCLELLRQQYQDVYQEIATRLRQMHANRLKFPANFHETKLDTYCRFIGRFADLGATETAAVLDESYWLWALDMLHLPSEPELRKKYPGVLEQLRGSSENVSAIFGLLHQLLTRYADASSVDAPTEGPHLVVADSVPLLRGELEAIVQRARNGTREGVPLWFRAAKLAERDGDWRDSAPGKFLGTLVSSQTDANIRDLVERGLVNHVDVEEDALQSILQLVLHFYVHGDESDAVFKTLVKVIHMWEGSESEFLFTAKTVYELAPYPVLGSLDGWAAKFLESPKVHVRQGTGEFLETVFDAEPISGHTALDYTRSFQARKLSTHCLIVLEQAFGANKSRARYEPMIQATLAIGRYLKLLRKEANAMVNSDDGKVRAKVSTELRHELDEVDATIRGIAELDRDICQQWVLSEPILPSTAHDVRRSVELAPSDESDSDQSAWDEDEYESESGR